jgi:hypothetical protein
LHALCNNEDKVEGSRGFVKDSFLDNFVSKFRNSDPQDRADFLYEDVLVEENHQKIADASEAKSGTQQEQKENPEDVKSDQEACQKQDPESKFLYCHYVTYVEKNGDLWQLDGRISTPINKGKMTDSNLGIAVCKIVRDYLKLMPPESSVSLMALAPNLPQELFDFE